MKLPASNRTELRFSPEAPLVASACKGAVNVDPSAAAMMPQTAIAAEQAQNETWIDGKSCRSCGIANSQTAL